MHIRMLKTEHGSIDGIRVATYIEGEVRDLRATDGARELAAAFVGAGLAEEVQEAGASAAAVPVKPGKAAKTK